MLEKYFGSRSDLARAILPFLVDSIRLANEIAPAKWGVTPYKAGIRLNVGFCESLTVTTQEVDVLVQRDSANSDQLPAGVEWLPNPKGRESYYKSAPGSGLARIPTKPIEQLEKALAVLQGSHEKILSVAAKHRQFNKGSRDGHRNWAILDLERALGESLPRPASAPQVEEERAFVELRGSEVPDRMSLEESDRDLYDNVRKARELSPEDLSRLIDSYPKIPQRRQVVRTVRNPGVIRKVLERAGGFCEDCRAEAPFRRSLDGTPYLEVHHLMRLADGGLDTVENARALCPNCHRRAHDGGNEQ